MRERKSEVHEMARKNSKHSPAVEVAVVAVAAGKP